ncbi:cysteine peptidase family C39 domain-containing protein [Flavobacterium sp. SUN046]|uniref:cysteine peptidase family C39 domain-containing protein n=1 Tax=Flavobacterium sp. SUN046 TaxID=3002440 RepID=UPI003FA3B53B
MIQSFPIYIQAVTKDCGLTCLKIIAKHFCKTVCIQSLRNWSETNREGSELLFRCDFIAIFRNEIAIKSQ